MRFFLAEERGLALVVGAVLISLAVWFLFFSNLFSLLFLGIIPCSAVVYAPFCKMREPMSTIKRTLICCQLVSFAFVFFALPGLR
jgi:heme O synthase-like polyprenyltransferase